MRVAPLETGANSRPSTSVASEPASLELAEVDVLGAALDEPLDVYNFAALHWWLHAVSWDQACTFVDKATLDFKVGCFSIVHLKAISVPPGYSHKKRSHSNNRYRTTAANRAVVSGVELSNRTSYHQIYFATLLLKNCFILYIRFVSTTGQPTRSTSARSPMVT